MFHVNAEKGFAVCVLRGTHGNFFGNTE